MFPRALILVLLVSVAAAEDMRNSKRSISSFGLPWNSALGHPWTSLYLWPTNPGGHGKKEHFTSHDLEAAVAAAKEATAAAALAQKKVRAAREQLLIQERVAAAKEAAAHAAIQKSEALAVAAHAVQKSAAHAVGHFDSTSWIGSKPVFHHWG